MIYMYLINKQIEKNYKMKKKIHPKLYTVSIVCRSCKNEGKIVSTKKDIEVNVCYKCHPFYLNKDFTVYSAGQIDKFNKKYNIKK